MNYTIYSANEWIYPEERPLVHKNNRFRISCPRGSYASCQFVTGPLPAGGTIDWRFQYISGNGNDEFHHGIEPELFQLCDVAVEANTGTDSHTVAEGEIAGGHVTRLAPFRVYDAMKPAAKPCISRAEQEAFYVRCRIDKQAEPGLYTCGLWLEADGERCEILIEIEVFQAIVPERETLSISNWFSLDNMADRHGLARWSEAHWEMIAKYAGMMRHARQTHFLVPFELVEYEALPDGRISFCFNKIRRLIQLFLSLGFQVIEGGPVAVQLQLGDPYFMLKADRSIRASSMEGYVFIAQYLQAWFDFLKENQWLEQTVQHAADEPFEASVNDYTSIVCMVRRFMPGIKIIEAVCTHQAGGTADILIPTNRYYEEHREAFERLRDLGDSLWFYTCSVPGGYYMNRLMDAPLLRTRLLHWGNRLYRLEGYLHWGFNGYRPGQDPFEANCPVHMADKERKRSPAGNTHIVYPGDDGPWGSVRLEAMRAGVEDYELLKLLAYKDREAAHRILLACMRSFSDACSRAAEFDITYRRLLEALSHAQRT